MMHLTDITGRPLGIKPEIESQEHIPLSQRPSSNQSNHRNHDGNLASPSLAGTGAPGGAGLPRIRRRNRMITSCLECRRRKLKCDKSHPCTNCTKAARDCLFLAPALDSASQLKLTEIKEKMGSLERVLEQDVAKKTHRSAVYKGFQPKVENNDDVDFGQDPEDDEPYLEPSPLAVADAAYDDEADDDLADLGVQMGKLRLTDRLGGYFRPRLAEELTVSLNDRRNDHRSPEEKQTSPEPYVPGVPSAGPIQAPGPTYIAPSSSFFFSSGQSSASMIDFLPSKIVTDQLLNQYWAAVHPIVRLVHRQSFEERYVAFWSDVSMGLEPPNSLQAIFFAVMFCGVVSMSEADTVAAFGTKKKGLVDNFLMGTETALGRANTIRTSKVETLQAFVMYLIPLVRGEVSRSHSTLVGTGIRIAQCMGLHRDPSEYGLGLIECHVRRLIWYQLCFLDIRTCEAQGPRPGIRSEEFDTELPLNVNDVDLSLSSTGDTPPPDPVNHWTEMTPSLIRMECVELHRAIWVDRPRLEKKQTSLTTVLKKIEDAKTSISESYLSPAVGYNEAIPLHRAGRLMTVVMITRARAMVLHRYHNSVAYTIPDRLREIIITGGIECLEASIQMETDPALSLWSWYHGAIQQYHTALLLMLEIFAFPYRKEADRIWACLDYIFEVPSGMSREQKGRWVMTQVRDRVAFLLSNKKVKVPQSMIEKMGGGSTTGQSSPAFSSGHDSHAQPHHHSPDSLRGNKSQSRSPPMSKSQAPPRSGNNKYQNGIGKVRSVANTTGEGIAPYMPTTPSSSMAYPIGPSAQYIAPISNASAPQRAMAPTSVLTPTPQPSQPQGTQAMIDIDWREWDKLFPPDINTGQLNIPQYT